MRSLFEHSGILEKKGGDYKVKTYVYIYYRYVTRNDPPGTCFCGKPAVIIISKLIEKGKGHLYKYDELEGGRKVEAEYCSVECMKKDFELPEPDVHYTEQVFYELRRSK